MTPIPGGPGDVTLVHIAVNNPKTVPAGPLYVAAALSRAGYAVDFRDRAVDSYLRLNPRDLAACWAHASPP